MLISKFVAKVRIIWELANLGISKFGKAGRIGRIGKAGRAEKAGRNGGAEIINKFFLDFNIFFVLLPPSHKGCCNRLRLYP